MIKKNYLSDHHKLALTILFVSVSWSFPICTTVNLANSFIFLPVNIGLIYHDDSVPAKIWSSCIRMALSDFYASHPSYRTRLILSTADSKRSVVGAAAAALDLIQNKQVQVIIGPTTSREASFVIDLGEQAQVPIISFSATSPTLTSLGSSYFFQFAQNDSSQVKAVSAVVKAFGWREVVPICIDTLQGRGILPFLADALQEVGTAIPYLSVISPSATDDQIVEELHKLMMMQTRVFIVHMTPDLGSRLFTNAKEIGMMSEGYGWLTTSGITNRLTSMNSSVIHSMNGVIGVQTYIPITGELEEFKLRWKRKFQDDYPQIDSAELDVFGFWAYDATFAVAMAIEQVIGTASSFGFQQPSASNNSTDILLSFPVSPYGRRLSEALSTTRFIGLAGDFNLIDGQLQSSSFRIINVNSRGERIVGFWTPQHGLVSKMSSPNSTKHLGPVLWPGDSSSVPKGWEIPTKGKKLRIGVPVRDGFTELVKVEIVTTAYTTVTGFSIDIFEAVVELLPYSLPYEFIPFAKSDGTKAGSYNDLCDQVYFGNLDAAVGDITITANRSQYVDFTMPYTESGLAMVVPVKNLTLQDVLSFLKPWRWDLWLAICFFFFYIGFVVWVLEHRTNKDFRGPLLHQVGTSVWFVCSSMVFAHRERAVRNSTRFVVIIWLFFVLILTANYTANLSSLLTIEQLQPTVTDIEVLVSRRENVGYIKNSFAYDLLKQVGFDDSKLKDFETMREIDEALSKGSENSGIAAFVDEAPYMKLFVAKNCYKYTMIEPIFKTEGHGHGFVFQKGSPLLSDVSQAILNVTGREKIMMNLEDKWFNNDSNCGDYTNSRVPIRIRNIFIIFATIFISFFVVVICKRKFKNVHIDWTIYLETTEGPRCDQGWRQYRTNIGTGPHSNFNFGSF